MTDEHHPELTENASGSQSRRGFLAKSAFAGGALGPRRGAGVTLADEHTTDEMLASFEDVEGTDVDVLNYALSLEHLESAFYETALETFDEQAFVESDALSEYDESFRTAVYGYVETVAAHEAQHATVFTQAVELLGGEAVMPGEYEFGFETVGEFLSLAQVLENTGVAAYAGAAPFVESPDLLSAALSVHSVEARHAAVTNFVTGTSRSRTRSTPRAPSRRVLDAVSQFIVSETETPTDGTGNETATPSGNETMTPSGNETATRTPSGNGTDTRPATARSERLGAALALPSFLPQCRVPSPIEVGLAFGRFAPSELAPTDSRSLGSRELPHLPRSRYCSRLTSFAVRYPRLFAAPSVAGGSAAGC